MILTSDLRVTPSSRARPAAPTSRLLRAVLIGDMRGRSTRLSVATACMLIAAAAATQAFSTGVGEVGRAVLLLLAAALLPAALAWLRCSPEGRYPSAFCVGADAALVIALGTGFESSFTALSGTVLFAPLAFVADLSGRRVLWRTHLTVAVAIVTFLAIRSIVQGSDVYSVLARAMGLAVVLGLPVAFSTLYRRLRADLDDQQIDRCSGLYNRIGLETAAVEAPGAVLVALSARMEGIDEASGHAHGTHPDTAAALRLRRVLPDRALVARTGRSEYAVVGWVTDHAQAAEVMASWLSGMDALAAAPLTSEAWGWGVAVVDRDISPTGEDSIAWTIQRALAAAELRRTSRSGRHAVEDSSSAGITYDDIASLVESGGPDVVFQPIHRPDTDEAAGFEALSRFRSHSPFEWFAAAARLGMGASLERSAIVNALHEARDLPGDAFLSVNVSPAALLAQPGLATLLITHSHQRPLIVELTENVRIEEFSVLEATLSTLRNAGIRIALDDVGAGYAGLNTVLALKPDVVKIDSYMIRGVDTDPQRAAAVTAVISVAAALDAECVCEGIETAEELSFYVSAGATFLQGFKLGRPAPARDVTPRRDDAQPPSHP